MSEKPLHVRVAEALGLDTDPDLHERDETSNNYSQCTRCGSVQGWDEPMPALCCPRWDTDWSFTGPLIERLHISTEWEGDTWSARAPGLDFRAIGATPLLAACNLLLVLDEVGKLKGLLAA